MIRTIKYNRSCDKLINILSECTIHTNAYLEIDHYYIKGDCYFHPARLYYIAHKSKKLFIYYYNFEFNKLTFGLSQRDIINIINDKFNENNYKLIIKE